MRILLASAALLLIVLFDGCAIIKTVSSSPFDRISDAQRTGDFSLCEQVGNYRFRCIAETELQQKMIVQYDCCNIDKCNAPQCMTKTECGGGGGGCRAIQFCIVNASWLCVSTGGTASILSDPKQFVNPPFSCTCPKNQAFIDNYGCIDCSTFENPETIQYCKTIKNSSNGGYFKKYCPT